MSVTANVLNILVKGDFLFIKVSQLLSLNLEELWVFITPLLGSKGCCPSYLLVGCFKPPPYLSSGLGFVS